MIKFVDEFGSINYCLCTVLVSFTVMYSFLVKIYVYAFLVKKCVAHDVHHLLFKTRFFVLTKFSMPNVSHIDAHRIYDLTLAIVYLFKFIFNLGPRTVRMIPARRYLNPALLPSCCKMHLNYFLAHGPFFSKQYPLDHFAMLIPHEQL